MKRIAANMFTMSVIVSLMMACQNQTQQNPASQNPSQPQYSVSGVVQGLRGSLILALNNTENLTVNANGNFSFNTAITSGENYDITVNAQPNAQTCNVDPGSGTITADVSNINVTCHDDYFFYGNDGTTGYELWKTDGTNSGTILVKDIYLGSSSSFTSNSNYYMFTWMGNYIYFAASDGINGIELWRSDGTASGTQMVKDINTIGDSLPRHLTRVGNYIYFSATDGVNGYELWKTDGTEAGTSMVANINTVGDSNPRQMVDFGGVLYFVADSDSHMGTLYKYDAAGGGGIENVVVDKNVNDVAVAGGKLYMAAIDNAGNYGRELYVSDGTPSGETLVKDINPGTTGSLFVDLNNHSMFAIASEICFSASDGTTGYELWCSDGTSAGTAQVKDINPGGNGTVFSDTGFANVGDKVLFNANDGSGNQLWITDGTAAGTEKVQDGIWGINYFSDGETVYFVNSTTTYGYEPWKSDGTTAGTSIIKDIAPGVTDGALGT